MLKVGVLMGGMSIEREVSFNSGRTICDHLDTQLFQVIPLFQTEQAELYILPWTFLYRGKIADFQSRLASQAQKISWDDLPQLVDFVYIAVHGAYAEDGRLQAMLELLKVPYLGSKMFASALGMDKKLHNDHVQAHGIAVPKNIALSVTAIQNYDATKIEQDMHAAGINIPCVVKPVQEGSSFGVFVVKEKKDLERAIKTACYISSTQGKAVLIEEKIVGMEFTCIIITDATTGKLIALPPTEVLISKGTDIFDYQQKYMPGAVHEKTPARCSAAMIEKIQQTCIATMEALGFTNLARIDGFLTSDERVVIIDSNPLSGMGPATFLFRQAAEINIGHTELINHLIKTELKQYGMNIVETKTTHTAAKRLKVAVLFGGPSNEKEISLESGRNVVYKLSPEKYEVYPLFMDHNAQLFLIDNRILVCHSTKEIEDNLAVARKIGWSDLPSLVDFVFIALHGSPGEDGIVQGALEMLRMPYNGSGVFTSSLCMDKYKTTQFLQRKGFDVPAAWLVSRDDLIDIDTTVHDLFSKIQYPCIVKPVDDGCSVMVFSPKNKEELIAMLHELLLHKKYALVEERIVGMELTVGVLGNQDARALTPSQTVVKGDLLSLEEKFLPGAGENQTPALLSPENLLFVQEKITAVYKAVGCRGYARIDCFFQDAAISPSGAPRVVIIEINTLPGLTPATCIFHQAAEQGMRPMEFIDAIIELGLQEHAASQIISVDTALQVQKSL